MLPGSLRFDCRATNIWQQNSILGCQEPVPHYVDERCIAFVQNNVATAVEKKQAGMDMTIVYQQSLIDYNSLS